MGKNVERSAHAGGEVFPRWTRDAENAAAEREKRRRWRKWAGIVLTVASAMLNWRYGVVLTLMMMAVFGGVALIVVACLNERDDKVLRRAIRSRSLTCVMEELRKLSPDAVYMPKEVLDTPLIRALFASEQPLVTGEERVELTVRGHACTISEFRADWDTPEDRTVIFDGYALLVNQGRNYEGVAERRAVYSEGRWTYADVTRPNPCQEAFSRLLPDAWLREFGEMTGCEVRAAYAGGSGALMMVMKRTRPLFRYCAESVTPEQMQADAADDVGRIAKLIDLALSNRALFGEE